MTKLPLEKKMTIIPLQKKMTIMVHIHREYLKIPLDT